MDVAVDGNGNEHVHVPRGSELTQKHPKAMKSTPEYRTYPTEADKKHLELCPKTWKVSAKLKSSETHAELTLSGPKHGRADPRACESV